MSGDCQHAGGDTRTAICREYIGTAFEPAFLYSVSIGRKKYFAPMTIIQGRREQYTHVFFDLDHTLWDFESNSQETLQEVYHIHGLPDKGVPSFDAFMDVYRKHNERLWERFRNGFIRRDELRWKRMWLTLLDFKVADEALSRRLSDTFLQILPTKSRLFPNAIRVLEYLKQKGYRLFLITNGFEETQWLKIRHSGIDSYFEQMITSEKAGSLKPHPEIFQYAFMQTGGRPQDSIMVGDNFEVDIMGAARAGMDQVYFSPQGPAPGKTATYTVQDLIELETIF